MTDAFIGLGSNLGDGIAILKGAWALLGEVEGITLGALSHPYLTAPVGMESNNRFTNAVGLISTTLPVRKLLAELLGIESLFGRRRDPAAVGYQDRSLDIDILAYGDTIVDSPDLVLPHPRMSERLFVLMPLAEIAPGYRQHPDGPTAMQLCSGLLEDMRMGRLARQEIKIAKWEE